MKQLVIKTGTSQSGPFVSGTTKPPADGIQLSPTNNSGGNFQHYGAFIDQVAAPVWLNQVSTTNPGAASGGCCCGSNNNEPVMANYKPPLSKSISFN